MRTSCTKASTATPMAKQIKNNNMCAKYIKKYDVAYGKKIHNVKWVQNNERLKNLRFSAQSSVNTAGFKSVMV